MNIHNTIVHKNGHEAIIVDMFPHIDCQNPENDGTMYRVLLVGKSRYKYISERIMEKNWKIK